MSKKILALFLVCVIFTQIVPSVSALTIDIASDGTLSFFQDDTRVLGESDEVESAEKEVEVEKEADEKIEKNMEVEREVRIKPTNRKETRIEVREKVKEKGVLKENLQEQRKLKEQQVEQVKVKFEAEKEGIRVKRQEGLKELEQLREETKDLEPVQREEILRLKREEIQGEIKADQEALKEERSQLQEDRQEFREGQKEVRKQLIEVKDELRENRRELQLGREGGPKARLKSEGAEITVNAETGTVKIVTPNGVEHELNNLPDDVIAKLQERTQLSGVDAAEIEMEVENDGSVKHRVRGIKERRRFLGFFQREVEGEAVVDDATGEVAFEENESTLNRVMKIFEF